jgi:hypothetical protein
LVVSVSGSGRSNADALAAANARFAPRRDAGTVSRRARAQL